MSSSVVQKHGKNNTEEPKQEKRANETRGAVSRSVHEIADEMADEMADKMAGKNHSEIAESYIALRYFKITCRTTFLRGCLEISFD